MDKYQLLQFRHITGEPLHFTPEGLMYSRVTRVTFLRIPCQLALYRPTLTQRDLEHQKLHLELTMIIVYITMFQIPPLFYAQPQHLANVVHWHVLTQYLTGAP